MALPLDVNAAPSLRELSNWDVVVADYESTGMSIGKHPMELIRPSLEAGYLSSAELGGGRHGESVRVAGLVTAKQRPATAKGITFMTLEDEFGTINLIVPRPVYERHRLAVRTAPMVRARGRLELHGVNVNVLVSELHQLQRPDLPLADVRAIEPPRERESGRGAGREIGELQVKRVAAAGLHNPETGISPSLANSLSPYRRATASAAAGADQAPAATSIAEHTFRPRQNVASPQMREIKRHVMARLQADRPCYRLRNAWRAGLEPVATLDAGCEGPGQTTGWEALAPARRGRCDAASSSTTSLTLS